VWDAFTGQQLLKLEGHTDWVHSAAFSPNGSRVATASQDGTVRIWDAKTGKELCALISLANGWVVTDPGGHLIATTSRGLPVRCIGSSPTPRSRRFP